MSRLPTLALLPALLVLGPPVARAETVATCTGFITSLPAVISTQGNWCMSQDLSTAIAVGTAVTIATNNVTIDCNGFKLGGLAAGADSETIGIRADNRLNATIRNCNIRGFRYGIAMFGDGSGHLVERNRLDGNLQIAVLVSGYVSVVRDNMVTDTGGTTKANFAMGIQAGGNVDILDNLVAGAVPGTCCTSYGSSYGISSTNNEAALVARNRVHGLTRREDGELIGISLAGNSGAHAQARDNHVVGIEPAAGIALRCFSPSHGAAGNYLAGFATALTGCTDHGNFVN